MRFVTHSVDETEALGERLAKTLHGGEIIAFTGDLGAGKTAFTRGLARGLGIPMRVTSPTYTIVNEYTGGRLPLFHFDMYRLGSSATSCLTSAGRTICSAAACARWSGAKTSRTPCRAQSRCASAAIRTSSARSPSKEAGWMRILAFETSAKAASVALLEGDMLLGELYLNCGLTHSRTLLESAQRLLEITELTAKDIDAVACAAGPGKLYRRAHRRGGRQGLCMGAGYPVLRRFDAGGHGMAGIGIFRHRVLRHGRAALPGVSRTLPCRERHTDTPVPRLRRFARRGAARTGKLRKTENNGWRWRTVVL